MYGTNKTQKYAWNIVIRREEEEEKNKKITGQTGYIFSTLQFFLCFCFALSRLYKSKSITWTKQADRAQLSTLKY